MKIRVGPELRNESRGTEMLSLSQFRRSNAHPRALLAFTLLEVMIAIAIFFMAMFTILALVSQTLRSARSLSQNAPTPGMVAAELSQTNKLEEGFDSGDFGDLYPDYTWETETMLWVTNGMFQVDCTVYHGRNVDSTVSLLLYKPESATGLSTRSAFSGQR
ncbi:MAG: hypothetical protein ABIP71_13605 [Verrucomicrobiota bacterium]